MNEQSFLTVGQVAQLTDAARFLGALDRQELIVKVLNGHRRSLWGDIDDGVVDSIIDEIVEQVRLGRS